MQDVQDQFAIDKHDLEKRLRASEAHGAQFKEEAEEARDELASFERNSKHDLGELDAKHEALKKTMEEIKRERDEKALALASVQQKLSERDSDVDNLENQVVHLKTQAGDADTLVVMKRELSDQVAHITKLEATNLSQSIELKQLRKQQKSIEVVQEEKRMLEGKIRLMNSLREELGEVQLQKQILEDERASWASYLEGLADEHDGTTFDSPQELAQAFVQERIERAALTNNFGQLTLELATKDERIRELEDNIGKLRGEVAKAQPNLDGPEGKIRARLERERVLASKEIAYLRAQIEAFEAEETEFSGKERDEAKAKQLQDVEKLVDEYRQEVKALNDDLNKTSGITTTPKAGSKRARDDSDDERLGEVKRKNRTLQETISQMTVAEALLQKELAAHKTQLASLQSKSRTRVLELRSNPTADAEALKMSILRTLRAENVALLEQLQGRAPTDAVPQATLERTQAELSEAQNEISYRDKRMQRLREIFTAKTNEFREAIASMLGWKVDFLPNGRFRVTSMFHPPPADDPDGNSIVFDGEAGTMKCSGGSRSAFADELRENIEFWVEGRREIPCFLAACTLEFYDRGTRAAKA